MELYVFVFSTLLDLESSLLHYVVLLDYPNISQKNPMKAR